MPVWGVEVHSEKGFQPLVKDCSESAVHSAIAGPGQRGFLTNLGNEATNHPEAEESNGQARVWGLTMAWMKEQFLSHKY